MRLRKLGGIAFVTALLAAGGAEASVRQTLTRPMAPEPLKVRPQTDGAALARAYERLAANRATPKAVKAKAPIAAAPQDPFEALSNPAVSFRQVGSRGLIGGR